MHLNEIRSHEFGPNVPTYERIVTSALGVAAIVFGLRERGVVGWAIAAAGVGLAARGISGRCAMTRQIARRARVRELEHARHDFATASSSVGAMGESSSRGGSSIGDMDIQPSM